MWFYRNMRIGPSISISNISIYDVVSMHPHYRAVQCFLGSKLAYNSRTIYENEKKQIRDYCVDHDNKLYIHSQYCINLLSDDHEKVDNGKCALRKLLSFTHNIPSSIVHHTGSGDISKMCNYNDLDIFIDEYSRTRPKLLFENCAGEGRKVGKDWDEFRLMFESLDYGDRFGICYDTQHGYGSGIHRLDTHEDVVSLFDNAESICNTGITLIHLNDSGKLFNSKVDRHRPIGYGYIWNDVDNMDGLRSLIAMCEEKDVDCIWETTDYIYSDLTMRENIY